jgi:WD40 repeat protein
MFDKSARLWDSGKGKLVGTLPHQAAVVAVAFSPDEKRIATGQHGPDERVLLWDTELQKLCGQLPHRSAIPSVAFSRDGHYLLTGSGDYIARLWDLGGVPRELKTFSHDQWIRAVAFHPTNPKLILTGSTDKTARLWDVETGRQIGPPLRHKGMVFAAGFSPDGKTILTGSADGAARLWKAPSPVEGAPERIKVWIQIVTGMELDQNDVPHALDAKTWHERYGQLQKLGGPPLP